MSTAPFRVRVTVRLDAAVNDPQGNTVRDALHALGHADVRAVRVGKAIDLELDASDASDALARADRMCRELLVNPVIETYETEVLAEA
jgi:phosphoribosylformylglycinamidine synthase subunit PurS